MIIRKLRAKRSWSQEQLADFCGLNVRTIQRVESGQKASLETLKCLASVFEVELSTLTEDIKVIDKTSEEWKGLPLWFRFNMHGVNTRKAAVNVEIGLFIFALIGWVVIPHAIISPVLFLAAYFMSALTRFGDARGIWKE